MAVQSSGHNLSQTPKVLPGASVHAILLASEVVAERDGIDRFRPVGCGRRFVSITYFFVVAAQYGGYSRHTVL
jgi:hypothetical protein